MLASMNPHPCYLEVSIENIQISCSLCGQCFKISHILNYFQLFENFTNSSFCFYRNVLRESITCPSSPILFKQTTRQFTMPCTWWIFIQARCQRVWSTILFWYLWLLFSFPQSTCRSNIQELIRLMISPRESIQLISLLIWKESS
jgi:hypothetical protein